jgi:hypothetical protein
MDLPKLRRAVQQAVNLLYKHDDILISKDASEWAIAHRLAVYLEQLIPGWHIDCEYNRQGVGIDPKTNPGAKIVRPDIIVHHREKLPPGHNLLVIELKKKETDSDSGKVRDYTSPPQRERKFQYQYGLTVSFVPEFKATWYANGTMLGGV